MRVLAARPQLIRVLNEQLLLDHIRHNGPCSRAELVQVSGLSKSTVSATMSNVERSGLVREAGHRRGAPGPAAQLYEITPEAGFVVALDVGRQFLRGALADLSGAVLARETRRSRSTTGTGRVTELIELADRLTAEAGIDRARVAQTVVGSPGVYDRGADAIRLTGGLTGWDQVGLPALLRDAFGTEVIVENDVDAAALAEQAHGHGQRVGSFAFVTVGTGIGMGLVLDGRLHRGAHGTAGEIAFLPLAVDPVLDEREAQRRGCLEAAVSSAAVTKAARRAGMRGVVSARRVFAAAARGDARAIAVVAEEATLVAKAICTIVVVADPALVVLGGGIGQAPGFVDLVTARLADRAPNIPPVKVSALGSDAVVNGCLAAGLDRAWELLTAAIPAPTRLADQTHTRIV
ncbi:MAG TPA: ROK family transcriptional regulator [Pseudonocardiaceae bacterium]|nr:ROK family transcriptional regulator [Pseudonocardiaceae bacterium]